ncbi:MAG: DUF4145 domain-containing protein [Cyanobacteria bacterium P01_A01_bin.3]
MKSIIFYLPGVNSEKPAGTTIKFTVPTLPAYAIEYSELTQNSLGCSTEDDEYEIAGDQIIWKNSGGAYPGDAFRFIIHYHGIRDFSLLFPSVADPSLRERLGEFYREQEINFNDASWLSFILMCGAIFEGVLFSKIGRDDSFKKLIESAHQSNFIDLDTKKIMHSVRGYRNLVHAHKHTESYVLRKDAMDVKTTLDKLIRAT